MRKELEKHTNQIKKKKKKKSKFTILDLDVNLRELLTRVPSLRLITAIHIS